LALKASRNRQGRTQRRPSLWREIGGNQDVLETDDRFCQFLSGDDLTLKA